MTVFNFNLSVEIDDNDVRSDAGQWAAILANAVIGKGARGVRFDPTDKPAPSGLSAENDRWLTAGELVSYLNRFPADMPITALQADGDDWLNVIGASNPNETGESSIILITRDDFDTRQW